jgi:FixJ family two-component response regulator
MNLKIGTLSVELHRSRLMEKMGAASVAHLIRMLTLIGDSLEPREPDNPEYRAK